MGTYGTGPASELAKAVNAEIRSLAARRNMNQTELAEAMGIGQSTVSRIIYKDGAPLNINLLDRVAHVFDVEASDIVNSAVIAMRVAQNPRPGSREDWALAAKERTTRDVDEQDYL
ncbi:helix-turn-helix domain-containing protein [Rothia koreensis]|uniref:helix-turn-helix domain-containing protein n=1 Tax=Rothia koreensis TaxID=592378 RepID=UPI003FCC7A13